MSTPVSLFLYCKNMVRDYFNRGKYILDLGYHEIKPKKVNLHYWNYSNDGSIQNRGDYLSTVIVNYMLELQGIDGDRKIDKTKNLYAIGSILQCGYVDATIWGSGYL